MEGGGLHPARPAAGGGSDASQSSTELLRLEEDEGSKWYLGWAVELECWADLMGYGVGLRPCNFFPYFFLQIPFVFTYFLL
jgi:hypothetical protein